MVYFMRCGKLNGRVQHDLLIILPLMLAFVIQSTALASGQAQVPKGSDKNAKSTPPRVLTGDDANRATELDEAIKAAMKGDRWDEAIAKAQEALDLRSQVQGSDQFEAVDARWLLKSLRRVAPMSREDRNAYYHSTIITNARAETLTQQGKYVEAEPLYKQSLETLRRLLTEDNPDTAIAYNNQAMNLDAEGKYPEAQSLYEKSLEIFGRVFTGDHPNTATACNNLAMNLNLQGKYAQAQPLYEKALEIRRRLLTDDHVDTASSYNNLAHNFSARGQFAAAQPLLEKALEIRRRLLSDDHPHTAQSYNNVAYNLDCQGQHGAAQPLHEKALEIRRGVLTDNHPDTAISYTNLAANLSEQGNYAAAQSRYETALEINRRLLTDNHPSTATSYNNVAANLGNQGKYGAAQPLFEKALEIVRRLFTDDNRAVAVGYNNLGSNLHRQGKYAAAQPLLEKALEIDRRMLGDDHAETAAIYSHIAANLTAQGRYLEARDKWLSGVKALDAARLRIAFTGLERAGAGESVRLNLAAVLARLGEPAGAWEALEADLGRGLLDELAGREGRRLAPAEQARLRELIDELDTLDRLVEATPTGLDQAERARRFSELRRRRELASITLGEFQAKLVQNHGPLAGQVATLGEIQAALPGDTALVAWIDILPLGPNAADPDGEHWGVVVRSRGTPFWVPISGSEKDGLWTPDDTNLANRVRGALRARPVPGAQTPQTLLDRMRKLRLAPLSAALAATADGLPPARSLIVLPSRAMAGIPVEAVLAADDTRIVSYAPSATVFKYLREQPRPDQHAGLLALGDPVYDRPDQSSETKPLPDHGLRLNVVVRGSNAADHGLKDGDVLLAYNGQTINNRDDLKVIAEGDKPVPVEVWREGRLLRQNLAPGRLGVMFDPRPAQTVIKEERELEQALVAARSGGKDFAPLPGTRREVEALARLFKSHDRPARALLGAEASEAELDHLAATGQLGTFAFIHLAAHGVIDEATPQRSAVILTQNGLPDPLEQVMNHQPVLDGRLSVREIRHAWELKAELVTLSACETALGRESGGEGFVGFTQALLMSGARSVCLSLWKVDDRATALLMQRFYANLLGARAGLNQPIRKAEALAEAKSWLRGLTRKRVDEELKPLARGEIITTTEVSAAVHPFEHPYYWAGFVLMGEPG
jgi:tetratricopeptide (TPR) repeat protein